MRNKERGPLPPLKTVKGREGNFTKVPDLGLTGEDLPPGENINPETLLEELKSLAKAGKITGLAPERRRRKH